MSESDLTTVAAYRRNGYRLTLKHSDNGTLLTKFAFLASLFVKVVLDNEELTNFELNTVFKLGYVKGLNEADA